MIKKALYAVALVFLLNNAFAKTIDEMPDEIFVRQHWISYTTSFDIATKTEILGTLYRRVFSFEWTYDFYDPNDKKITTAKAHFFSFNAKFDVYDDQGQLLGKVKEVFFSLLPSFELYDPNHRQIAKAKMNFWGTKFTIYDTVTHNTMAVMSRPFFRFKNDWTIKVTNRELLNSKAINPKLLMTVAAFQGDMEEWSSRNDRSSRNRYLKSDQEFSVKLNKIQGKIKQLYLEQHVTPQYLPKTQELEQVAINLEEEFSNQSLLETDNSIEQLENFTQFCFDKVASNDVDDSTKKTILFLLKKRLENAQPF
ncbi:MAG: hypothetical protein K2X39_00850 [Silvanigrellaceae bacterium]|nr:hypothetical protein [Silvanigrellaceae bacterium]